MVEDIKKLIKQAVPADIDIEISASDKPDFGNYSTNVAFKFTPTSKASSGLTGKSPFEIAKELESRIKNQESRIFEKVQAVQPGFVNFWLSSKFLQDELKKILMKRKEERGKRKALKINLEYVSANPTGPLTMANGRGGFYGDVLANVLEKAGHKVTREYYVNDAGNQVRLLGESILAELGKLPPAENHYKGSYIKDLAKSEKRQATSKTAEEIGKSAAKILLKEIKVSLKKAGIKHDKWFLEDKNLRKNGEVEKLFYRLKKEGKISEKDNAWWLGDGVVKKSDKEWTYFIVDLAYHYDKLVKRKFDLAIDIWGADHHGYAQRMKKGVEALGLKPEKLKILITQLVRLVSGGKEVRMSKRKGEFVTMDDLLDEVGVDATRFFFLMHSLDTHMDFDLDLAKEKSNKNPVYYAQYALVRATNILRKSQSANRENLQLITYNLQLLISEPEIKLMLELIKFPDVLVQTAEDYQVHRLTKYAGDIASALHNFYEKERVVGIENKDLEKARLALIFATKIVLENLFDILGISKPNKM